MAILANRVAMERTLGVFKQSFKNLLFSRTITASATSSSSASSSTPPAAAAAAAEGASASKKPKRKKQKNLFEVAQFLPNWGLGYQMAKTHWTGVSYQITKINLYKDGRHGKAWGIVHKEGVPAADAPKKISGVHKRCWRYIPNSKATEETKVKPAEVQAA